ncbi:efflux RND transporter periplasmic adaptor subunit [Geobacter sp. DSM 9736]|uniref:efflux RND transporter periplasmic adaptor subunit n=1 Tax=Geobacter sp. DSM 9736 TaxID=1277350 RepID=UPI000B512504|nr:efflux RND transporter periplasmic adaptor subunit [Geobacter sp. DSM 9736]SNB44844.1 RND family efflux transporter, MFP subunit [Geobacter sp. DSM 9736]
MATDLSRLKIEKRAPETGARGRRRWRLPAALVGGIAIVAAALALFPRSVEISTASVSQVYPSQSFTLLNASGYVVADRKAAVAAKITGRLDWLGVEEGTRVREGQVLARLENLDTRAARDQAAANLAGASASVEQALAEIGDAKSAFERQKELVGQGIVAKSEFDAAEARYLKAQAALEGARHQVRSAQAALRNAQVNLDYTFIRAPFDAVVLTKNADVGDIVTPIGAAANAKAAVVTIADMNSLQVEADVSEANLGKVRSGQPCEIQLDAFPDSRFRGRVHMIVPTADRSKATVMVKVRFLDLDSRILPEMSAKVAFLQREVKPEESSPRLAVNPAAVTTRDGRQVIFVVKDGRVSAVPVTLGGRIGDMVEVRSGLKAGDKVALKPLGELKDGSKVTTADK